MGKVKDMIEDRLERAYSRGDADAYYGRYRRPHIWLDAMGRNVVTKERMTDEEIYSYLAGHADNPSGKKDWGYD